MKKMKFQLKTSSYRMCEVMKLMKTKIVAVALLALVGVLPVNATQTIRDLFDNLSGGHDWVTLDGLSNDVTTVGLQGTWSTSPLVLVDTNNIATNNIVYKDTWSLNWPLGDLTYGGVCLLDTGTGANGLLNNNSSVLDSIIDPNTGNPYGRLSSLSYATRPLGPSAYIDFKANGTYYFSMRIDKDYGWNSPRWISSGGLGFSTGNGTNDHFVGVGVTLPSPILAADGVTDIGDSSYISVGTLGQAGVPGNVDFYGNNFSGGPYYPCTNGIVGYWTNLDAGANYWGTSALLLGRLTTTTSGASTLDIKTCLPGCPFYTNGVLFIRTNDNLGIPVTLEPDINNITWEATYNFTETNVMTQLLVWSHGDGFEYDAIRVGTTYSDVIGLELIGAPTASPSVTNYAGTTVTVSENAAVNSGRVPMSFQWLSNSVALLDATSATLVLTNTTVDMTADYSVIVNNYYGTLTSAVTHITFLPAVPPFFVSKPVSIARYLGSPAATFTAVVDGTPPYTYQWQHAGTNIQSATTTYNVTNTLVLPPITLADAGNYSVTVTNAFGSTNSGVVTLSETVPAPGSYAAALTSYTNLYGYWRLDDNGTNDPTIYDYWGNHNGVALDPDRIDRMTFQTAGAPDIGFPTPHEAVQIGTGGNWWEAYRLNLAKLPYYTNNMTFTMWVNGGCQFVNHNGYNSGWGLENSGGSLQFDWNGFDPVNKTNIAWNSGLSVPADSWTFVALVVEPTQATVYMGTDAFTLTSAASGPLATDNGPFTNSDSTTIGDTAGLYPFGIGRNQWPWADDGNGAPWASMSGTWSDIAIFYQSLTAQQVTNLYLAGVGVQIGGTNNGAGNLNLNWLPGGTLQEATNSVSGPYTDVSGATPPYSVPISTTITQHYYRVRR